MIWPLMRNLQKRRDLLWSRITVEYAGFYLFLFGSIFLRPQQLLRLPPEFFVWGPLVLLAITAYDGLSQIRLYFHIEKIRKNDLEHFTLGFFPENAWVRINPNSPLVKKLKLSKSGLIALAEIPESIFSEIDRHIIAVGTLNGLRRVTLPINGGRATGILKIAIGLLACKNPERGYIYGNDTVSAYFGDIFHETFGTSEIEVLREYERVNRTEKYLSLGSTIASACLKYFEGVSLLEQPLVTRVAVAEGLIAAFGSLQIRQLGPNHRPPKILLKNPPPFSRTLLASIGILSVPLKQDLKIPYSEFAKFATLDLPEPFQKLARVPQVSHLREPIPLLTVLATLSKRKKVKRSFLDQLGHFFYGKQVISDYHLRKYSEKGLITLLKRGIITRGPLFDEILISEEEDVILAYAAFISEIIHLEIDALPSANDNDSEASESSLEELKNQLKRQSRAIQALQLELLAAQQELESLRAEKNISL